METVTIIVPKGHEGTFFRILLSKVATGPVLPPPFLPTHHLPVSRQLLTNIIAGSGRSLRAKCANIPIHNLSPPAAFVYRIVLQRSVNAGSRGGCGNISSVFREVGKWERSCEGEEGGEMHAWSLMSVIVPFFLCET